MKQHHLGLAVVGLCLLLFRVGTIWIGDPANIDLSGATFYQGVVGGHAFLILSLKQPLLVTDPALLADADVYPEVVTDSALPRGTLQRRWWLRPMDQLFSVASWLDTRVKVHLVNAVLLPLRKWYPGLLIFSPAIRGGPIEYPNRNELLAGMDFSVISWRSEKSSNIPHFISLDSLFHRLNGLSGESEEAVVLQIADLPLLHQRTAKAAFPLRAANGEPWRFPLALDSRSLVSLYPTRYGLLWLYCDFNRCTNRVKSLSGDDRNAFEHLRMQISAGASSLVRFLSDPESEIPWLENRGFESRWLDSTDGAVGLQALFVLQRINRRNDLSAWAPILLDHLDLDSRSRLATELFDLCLRTWPSKVSAFAEPVAAAAFHSRVLAGQSSDRSREQLQACARRVGLADIERYATLQVENSKLERGASLSSEQFFKWLFQGLPSIRPASFAGNWYQARLIARDYRSGSWRVYESGSEKAPTENAARALSWCLDFRHRNLDSVQSGQFTQYLLESGFLKPAEANWVQQRLQAMSVIELPTVNGF